MSEGGLEGRAARIHVFVEVAHTGAKLGLEGRAASKGAPLELRSDLWTHFGTPFGAFWGHFSDVGASLKPIYLQGRFWVPFWTRIGLP